VLVVYGLGLAWKALNGQITWTPEKQRVLGLVGLLAIWLIGAAAAWVAAATTTEDAVIYGMGWQGIFGHFIKPPGDDGCPEGTSA
jgi:hypothetical protein